MNLQPWLIDIVNNRLTDIVDGEAELSFVPGGCEGPALMRSSQKESMNI